MREHPRSRALAERAKAHLLAGVPMHWMAKWPGGFPLFVAEAHGSRFTDVDGHEYVDFCLGDTGAMSGHGTGGDAPRDRRAGGPRDHDDAADRGCAHGRRGADPAVRGHAMAVRAHRNGREPVLDPARTPRHRSSEGARLQLVLPRERRRDVRDARRRAGRGEAGQPRPAGAAGRDDEGGRVERPRRARGGARAAGRRARPHRARAHERRDRASRPRVPRCAPRPDAGHGHPARDRRDAHDLLRPRRVHEGARARAGRGHDRQADRRRHSRVGVRIHRRAGRPDRRLDRARGRRRRRSRRDARGQRALARGDAGDARRSADRRGVRAHDPARGAMDVRRRGRRSPRRACRGT